MHPPELIIFDCDGVLIDSEVISARVLIEALADVGVPVDMDHVQTHFLGRSWAKVAAEIRTSHSFLPGADFEEKYRTDLLAHFENELAQTVDIETLLGRLKTRTCVATSSSPKRTLRSLELTGLLNHFEGRIFTASEVARGKPAPDLFLHAAERMCTDPARCLVIEDSVPGIEAALAAGMPVLRFTGGSHLKGNSERVLTLGGKVQCFDNWQQFPEMVPLAIRNQADG
ncbi:HAD family hydrolase [Hoeflea sp. YIM 152468]|uniref:HAD family hydrolase n=1 Tax=Hoeflea sp. YIM 152468 TaxID=3031759 RepID=UPI0023DA4F16|nr:HAD family hydrolase [Hoeflea sp. YIM 152468]MDF1609235.1 HAD family hydrolase [Hoeflea sp. YIM 152468]